MGGHVCFHRRLCLILSVYVDDFKLVGKKESLKEGWRLITGSGLVLDPPTPLGDYLGCGQFPVHVTPSEAQRRLEHVSPLLDGINDSTKVKTGKPVKVIRYNMFGFFRQCVEVHCDLQKSHRSRFERSPRLAWMTTYKNPKTLKNQDTLLEMPRKLL